MKKVLSTIIILAMARVVFSQEYIQRPTAINTWEYVEEYGAEFPYNKNITIEYDEKGNLSYYHHIINYPGSPYTYTMWYIYDALNRLTFKQEYFQSADFGTYKRYYTYDEFSNLTECLVKRLVRDDMWFGNQFIVDSKDVYQYETGKLVRWDHLVDSTFVLQNYYLYEYSDKINWCSETKYNANGDPITKTERTYSDFQKPISIAVFNWSASMETWVETSLTKYLYSGERLVEKRITKWNNGTIGQKNKQLYSYDENGNCTQILFQTLMDDVYTDQNRAVYIYDENGLCTNANAERWNGTAWVLGGFPYGTYLFFEDYNLCVNQAVEDLGCCTRAEVTSYTTTPNPQYLQTPFNLEGEWYYEIQNENGSITYQHLEYVADTAIAGNDHVKVIVRTNHAYDKDVQTKVTHEYIYEEEGVVYWWNKEMQEFTTLYNLNANMGDEWTIEVGDASITMHVDTVEYIEYNGFNFRTLRVSDENDLFSGDIVCCFGHLTSFFPEKLMRHSNNFEVEGLRCYWVGDALIYHQGDEDCDAVYSSIHEVDETETDGFTVYPNPTDGTVTVKMQCNASLQRPVEFRITNLMGQTVMTGVITGQTINVSALPKGMYFFSVESHTVKLIIR